MKTREIIGPILVVLSVVAGSGCSSIGSKSSDDFSYAGPTVVETQVDPSVFKLNRDLEPQTDAQVIATVKDFSSKVTDVHLRFTRVPISIVLRKGPGDQWIGNLSKKELQELSVSGETMKYEATIVAKSKDGKVATSKSPLDIYVKTPEPARANS